MFSHSVLTHCSEIQLGQFMEACYEQADRALVSVNLGATTTAHPTEWTYPGAVQFAIHEVVDAAHEAGWKQRSRPAVFTRVLHELLSDRDSPMDGAVPMKTLVMTANFGGRDRPRPQTQQFGDVDYLYVTDDPDTPVPFPWTVEVHEREHEVPNLAAKWWRTHPPFDRGYDHVIWLDANMEMRIPQFTSYCIDAIHDGIAVWNHPRRNCIVDEMEASLGPEAQGGRYDHLPLRAQVESYLAEGYPRHNGLYATGTFVWTPPAAKAIGDEWYDECVKWGYQDQLSFPVVCWRHDITPGVFPLPQIASRYNARQGWWANQWVILHDHVEGTG